MNIQEAACLIDQAQRDNVTGSGDLEELKLLLDGDTEIGFITELVDVVNMPRAQIQSVVNEAISRVKLTSAECLGRKPPRRIERLNRHLR